MGKTYRFPFRTKHRNLLPTIYKIAKSESRSANNFIEHLLIREIGNNRKLLNKLEREQNDNKN